MQIHKSYCPLKLILLQLTFAVWYTFNRCDYSNCRRGNSLLTIVPETNNSEFTLCTLLNTAHMHIAHVPIKLTTIDSYLKIGLMRIFLAISSNGVHSFKTLIHTFFIVLRLQVSFLFSLRRCCLSIWWENVRKVILIGPIVYIVQCTNI